MKYYKTVLVTGGCGFIGTNLIFKLLNLNYRVINIDALLYPSIKTEFGNKKKNYLFLKFNLNNKNKIKELIYHYKPEIIFHLAAESHVDRSILSPKNFIYSNIIGTFNILESIREYINSNNKKKLKLVHVSTDEVYGSIRGKYKFNERSRYSPNSPYSASKASSDHLVYSWFKTYNLPVMITHCSNNYGPYQYPEKLIPLTINKAINFEKIPIYGKGNNIRNWIHVEDHIDALIKLSKSGKFGETYNIGSNETMKNLDIVKYICRLLDKKIKAKKKYQSCINFVKDRPGHDFKYDININKIQKTINWKPKISLKNGLEQTVDWYLNNIDWLKKNTKKLKLP